MVHILKNPTSTRKMSLFFFILLGICINGKESTMFYFLNLKDYKSGKRSPSCYSAFSIYNVKMHMDYHVPSSLIPICVLGSCHVSSICAVYLVCMDCWRVIGGMLWFTWLISGFRGRFENETGTFELGAGGSNMNELWIPFLQKVSNLGVAFFCGCEYKSSLFSLGWIALLLLLWSQRTLLLWSSLSVDDIHRVG